MTKASDPSVNLCMDVRCSDAKQANQSEIKGNDECFWMFE